MKTLEAFQFAEGPTIPAATIRRLAEREYLAAAEPVLFLGEPGTGKTHLAIGLGVAACRQRRRVRFTTAAALVNDVWARNGLGSWTRGSRRETAGRSCHRGPRAQHRAGAKRQRSAA